MSGPKDICGFTWPGIEFGEPPTYKHSFFEVHRAYQLLTCDPSAYVDALRLGDLGAFCRIEEESGDWWHPLLDRGAGAAMHFAADHGQLECVRFLVEQRGAEVNQRDRGRGWTPLYRAARMAHHTHAPYLAVFEYLLQHGADAGLVTTAGWPDPATGKTGPPLSVLDVATDKGRGWEPGRLKARLQSLINKHAAVAKRPVFVYDGPPIGPVAAEVFAEWERLSREEHRGALVPPSDWRAPPPAGYVDAQGMRRVEDKPWRPAGQDDGSCFLRHMTEAELTQQAAAC